MKEKNITINELAGMVKTGFDEMGKQFGKVDKRFEQVDKRFDRIDNRLTTLETGQEEIKLRLTNVAYRFEIVELGNQVKTLTKELKILKQLVMTKLKRRNNEA